MGVVGMIVGTLGMAYMQGRAQQQQAEAQAAQAEANANIAKQNAQRLDEQAKEQDRINKVNEENRHRQNVLQQGEQRARIGASGITATGSAAALMGDTAYNIALDESVLSANNRNGVDSIFNQSTDQTNQELQLRKQASNYRAAGKQAFINSMVGGVFNALTLGAGNYSSSSAAVQDSGRAFSTSGSIGHNTTATFTPTRSYQKLDWSYR